MVREKPRAESCGQWIYRRAVGRVDLLGSEPSGLSRGQAQALLDAMTGPVMSSLTANQRLA